MGVAVGVGIGVGVLTGADVGVGEISAPPQATRVNNRTGENKKSLINMRTSFYRFGALFDS